MFIHSKLSSNKKKSHIIVICFSNNYKSYVYVSLFVKYDNNHF